MNKSITIIMHAPEVGMEWNEYTFYDTDQINANVAVNCAELGRMALISDVRLRAGGVWVDCEPDDVLKDGDVLMFTIREGVPNKPPVI